MTEIETTECDECGDELEVGQVGTCDNCRPHKFAELNEEAKRTAREKYISDDYPHDDWWDSVYEDANRVAKILGFDLEFSRQLKNGRTVIEIGITFSGFWSQGDGACIAGDYRFSPDAIAEIKDYCDDDELVDLAKQLTVMQLNQRLQGCEPFRATIKAAGNYNNVSIDIYDYGIDEIGEPDESMFKEIVNNFNSWIYKSLEKEYDYLTSDKYVDERLEEDDKDFDSTGVEL